MRHLGLICLVALATLGNTAMAQVTVPNTFTSGTPAKASEVNANFQALATAINSLSDRVAKVEGTITAADVIGTYQFENLQIGIDAPSGETEVIAYHGPFTFNANGTFTSTFTGALYSKTGPEPDDGTITGNWTFANGKVTFTVTGDTSSSTLYAVNGGDLLLGAVSGNEPGYGHGNVVILIRTP
jgi:hypothetical protein